MCLQPCKKQGAFSWPSPEGFACPRGQPKHLHHHPQAPISAVSWSFKLEFPLPAGSGGKEGGLLGGREVCQYLLGLTWTGDMARASISRDQRKIHIFRTPAHRQKDGEAPRPRTGRGSTLLTTEEPKRTKRAAFSRYHHSLGSIPRGAWAGREFSPGTIGEEAGLWGS